VSSATLVSDDPEPQALSNAIDIRVPEKRKPFKCFMYQLYVTFWTL
jgi:hypothetical protein